MAKWVLLAAGYQSALANLAKECSGNGYLYVEDTALGMPQQCECLGCFTGKSCETFDESCTLNSLLVDESAFAPWFRTFASKQVSMSIGADYHYDYLAAPSYLRPGTGDRITGYLENVIFDLHAAVAHLPFKAMGYKIVTGAGALQVLSALVHSLGHRQGMKVYCEPPYFDEFPNIANAIGNTSFTTKTNLNDDEVIEILTYPNNPNGKHYPTRYANAIHINDYVYSWPHLTSVVPPQADIMVFSLSKLSGFAASRFGWALVKDEALAEKMEKYIFINGQGAGIESKYHAAQIIQTITASVGQPHDFFSESRNVVSYRWTSLQLAFKGSIKYSLDDTVPGVPYAWVSCKGTHDCVKDFKDAGIDVGHGEWFGSNNKVNIRLVILQERPTFEKMVVRIKALVASESSSVQV